MNFNTIEEAREAAICSSKRWGNPIAIVQRGCMYDAAERGKYALRSYIRGQRVAVGYVFTTLGTVHNFYDTCVEIVDMAS